MGKIKELMIEKEDDLNNNIKELERYKMELEGLSFEKKSELFKTRRIVEKLLKVATNIKKAVSI